MPRLPDAAILCGGLGTRIRSVLGAVPKALAPIAGRPFLEILIRDLAAAGVPRIVLCTGVGADQIRSHFHAGAWGADILFSVENEPLGTGGAVGLARPLLRSDPVLVMNGDSRVDGFDWRAFASGFDASRAAGRVAVVPEDGRADTGRIRIDAHGRIATFAERGGGAGVPGVPSPAKRQAGRAAKPHGVPRQSIEQSLGGVTCQNAGIYLLTRRLLDRIPAAASSMERDLLPAWLADGLDAFICDAPLTDIGTPERLARAQNEVGS